MQSKKGESGVALLSAQVLGGRRGAKVAKNLASSIGVQVDLLQKTWLGKRSESDDESVKTH
jgi:hypothetical protein